VSDGGLPVGRGTRRRRLVRIIGAEPVIHMIVKADLLPNLVVQDLAGVTERHA